MLNKISFGVICFTALLLMSWILIQLWPITVITPLTQPYKVITKKVKVGEQLIYVVDACKNINASSVVSRAFVDGIRYPAITTINNVPTGCQKTNVSILVPNFVAPGVYHLELNVQYKINAFRVDTYQFNTENFEVTI